MKEQANDVFEICSYVDGLEKKIDSMTEELTNMQNQIKEMQEDILVNNAKKALSEAQERLNARCEQIKSQVLEVKAQVKSTAKSIVDGRTALYRVSEFLGIKKRLLDIRENVRGAIKTTDKDIAKTALLGKGAYAIHQSGKWYTDENIDRMLMERHLNKKARRGSSKNHIKGSKKRTSEDDERFAQSFEKLVLLAQAKEGEQNGTV